MSYFHMRMHTIIGAKAFHDPVRDGKGWYHLAMVVRQKRLAVKSSHLYDYTLTDS
jgi:hypothetical protein